MITAVDSCILFDLFSPDVDLRRRARLALEDADSAGRLVICEVVYAELRPLFRSTVELDDTLTQLHVCFTPSSAHSAAAAGEAWGNYRRRGGPRGRLIADFLVGAHALIHADRLLTRDKRFYSGCFRHLRLVGTGSAP